MDDKDNKHWWLYLLKLQDGKYYVGITSKTPEKRMNEHVNGIRTAYWTAKHKPIEIIYREDLGIIPKEQAEKRENKFTRAVMKERGINSVRGGDLRDVSDYVQRFGMIWDKEGWGIVTYAVLMSLILAIFILDKMDWNFWAFIGLSVFTFVILLVMRLFER